MRILQVNCVYKQGSTGKIVACISDELIAKGHDVLVCYGTGGSNYDDHSIKVCSGLEHKLNAVFGRLFGIPFGGIYLSNYRIMKAIREFRPDIVHVHCVNGYMVNVYKLLQKLAKYHIKTVLTLHAEIFHTAGCEHACECEKWKTQCSNCHNYKEIVGSWFFDRSKTSWMKMYKAVNSYDHRDLIITAVSPWLTERAKHSAIMNRYQVECVMNGLDISVFHYRENKCLIDKKGYDKVVLFVTPYFGLEKNDIKGGRYIVPIASALPHFKFVVVAGRISGAVHNFPANVQIWGRAKSQEELAQFYSEADVTLLLSRRETFSMVTAESLCCGTPVVGFEAGGPESISLHEYCHFVSYGVVNRLCDVIKDVYFSDLEKKTISMKASKIYNSTLIADKYKDIYLKMLRNNT